MRLRTTALLALLPSLALAQQTSVTDDKAWSAPSAVLTNTSEAQVIIRVGDVDNLSFGWPTDFDPFCGRMTQTHAYPWEPDARDVAGLDRILLSSKFVPGAERRCGEDGYSGSFDKKKSKPVPVSLPTAALKGVAVKDAWLQLFIDDFQAPVHCSKFQVTLNGRRFAEAEKVLNGVEQSGPVGKLVTFPLPDEFLGELTQKSALVLTIDEATGSGDGWALDFARLLVNRKRLDTCRGTVRGVVLEKDGEAPIPKARVWLADGTSTVTDDEGRFTLAQIPTGYELVTASATGFADGWASADVGEGEENPELRILLEKGKALVFDDKPLTVGKALTLTVLFDQGKAELKAPSKPELDKVVAFLKANPTTEIELSGHTSSEGDAQGNRLLSYRRVKACKDYVVSKGVDPGRIIAVGHGPDLPVAPNDTEPNRKKNRRVELRVVKG